jgi:hypothetical protein
VTAQHERTQAYLASVPDREAIRCVMDAPDAKGRVLLDPSALAPDGTVTVTAISVSPDGGAVNTGHDVRFAGLLRAPALWAPAGGARSTGA